MKKRLHASALLAILSVISTVATAQWAPSKYVEIIANTGAGSGPDKTARLIQKLLQQNVLSVPASVVNKPNMGYIYLNQNPGSGNHLLVASKAMLSNHIVGRSPVSYTDITPVAHLFGEYIAVAVRSDSPIKNGKDLMDRLKSAPNAFSFGIANIIGNANHQAVASAQHQAGIDVGKTRNVVFKSGGDAITALLGGHVDVVPATVGSWISLIPTGKIRIIAVTSPRRLSGSLADVPTWKEMGYDVTVSNWRGLVAPKGLERAQIEYWNAAIRKMVETEEWKRELEQNHWVDEYMNSQEMYKYLKEDYAQTKSFLTSLGLAK